MSTAGPAAVCFHRARYDLRSTLLIQHYVRARVDGVFDAHTALAVGAFQKSKGIGIDGMVGKTTLGAFLRTAPWQAWQQEMIWLVADYYGLDIKSETLSIRYDPQVTLSVSQFETGNLRVIRIGPLAFKNIDLLRDTIIHELHAPLPVLVASTPMPQLLSPAQLGVALHYNQHRLRDPRAISTVQELVGASPSGTLDSDTLQRIAAYQQQNGIQVHGKLDDQHTLPKMVMELYGSGSANAAIRLIIDYYHMGSGGIVLDIFFQPYTARTRRLQALPLGIRQGPRLGNIFVAPGGPALVWIGERAFQRGFPALVHTNAHYHARARAVRAGIRHRPARIFLAESVEILSPGMRKESIDEFVVDAARALRMWHRIADPRLKRQLWKKFQQIRRKVIQRLNSAEAIRFLSANPQRQVPFSRLDQDYNLVSPPP